MTNKSNGGVGANMTISYSNDGMQTYALYTTDIVVINWPQRQVTFQVYGSHVDWNGVLVSNVTPTTVNRLNAISDVHGWPVRFSRSKGEVLAWFPGDEGPQDAKLDVTFDLNTWEVV
jgi:hypothetical protein